MRENIREGEREGNDVHVTSQAMFTLSLVCENLVHFHFQ